jgi:general secretion pathway protein D
LASLLITAVAACDQLSPPPAAFSAVGVADPPASASTAPILVPSGASPGRAVATMPASRPPESSIQPIIVRANDAPPAGAPPGLGAPGNAPADVTLNFSGADIRDVVNAVLGSTLKLNYVVDPEVSGPVTFNVSRPISRDEVLSTLEAVLNSRGATMVQSDGIIRVMPLRRDGKLNAAPPLSTGPATQAIGQRTEVFPLRFTSPADMQHVLEKVLPAASRYRPTTSIT